MTTRCAVIDLDAKTVENVIEYDAVPVGVPPGFDGNFIAVADSAASPGWGWDGSKTFDPNPSPVVVLPQTILSQDLMALFAPDDLTKIKAAIDANIQFWGLWSAMQAQKDPMLVTNARFLAGWNALVTVLGEPRMDEISVTLNVRIN
jgi:hypothetical protein